MIVLQMQNYYVYHILHLPAVARAAAEIVMLQIIIWIYLHFKPYDKTLDYNLSLIRLYAAFPSTWISPLKL